MSLRTPATVSALMDNVLSFPPGLDDRQQALGKVALANIPRPPRAIPPRLHRTQALQFPIAGLFLLLAPSLLTRLFRDLLVGPRGVARVDAVERGRDARGRQSDFWWVRFTYLVDSVEFRSVVRAEEADANDARNAGVLPIVVDPAVPSRVLVWWSALDVR